MKKIKYQGGLTKLIASRVGMINKRKFASVIQNDFLSIKNKFCKKNLAMELVSFSSSNDFYDQVLSICSFLRYGGTPQTWTIYSDGSHSMEQIKQFTSLFSFVNVITTDWEKVGNSEMSHKPDLSAYQVALLDYARLHPLGKRLYLYLKHDITKPTMFLDADIVFYHRASVFESLLQEKVDGWFLPDADWGCLDSNYKKSHAPEHYQVNGGLLLFQKNLTHIRKGLEFLKSLNGKYEYFTEQTVVHIILKENNFMPFDPRVFILNSDDQFDFSYLFPKEKMAMRHYTGPVRHKMWQRNWKWHLSM